MGVLRLENPPSRYAVCFSANSVIDFLLAVIGEHLTNLPDWLLTQFD